MYALSLKQPWAALLVYGPKTVEVRRWTSGVRGRILIHAARDPDPRDEAWKYVTDALLDYTTFAGGVIGEADLTGCVEYWGSDQFAADHALHLNEPGWFEPPVMYGFVFSRPRPLPFHECTGNVRFFRVHDLPAGPA